MKKISVVIPCYKEENSLGDMYKRLIKIFTGELSRYDYEIIFVDDCSPDGTWLKIKELGQQDEKVKGIHNSKNFGFVRNVFASLKYGTGDATFLVFGDLQDPPEKLVDFIEKWEQGYKVVAGHKVKSRENRIKHFARRLYYKVIDMLSDTKQLPMFNGFGLYDKFFIDSIKELKDPQPYLKGIVAEFGVKICMVDYEQAGAEYRKSSFNFLKNYDFAMSGITACTKILMRIATFIGVIVGFASFIVALIVFIQKLMFWDSVQVGISALTVGMFFLGGIQLFFLGILGEYILSINTRTMKRPLVVIDEKVNIEHQYIDIIE